MALSLAITATEEERLLTQTIEAMFGAQAGYAILKSIAADAEISGVDAVANGLVSFADNTATAETFAASIVANLGITVESTGSTAAVTDAVDFVAAQLNTAGEANWGAAVLAITTLFAGLEDDATYGAAATAYNVSVIESLNYSLDEANQAPYYGPADSGEFNLTTGLDSLMGTVGDDSFIARIVDNANTAQSADVIDGGEGNDTLTADIGNSQAFAITLETNSVENFVVRTQANAEDTNQNNMPDSVQIDAERMVGTDRYELNNGRADLIVEDVRIELEKGQVTKDITVAMVQTDPGDVDFGVYFDQSSLISSPKTQTDALINLNLMSLQEVLVDSAKPVAGNPYVVAKFDLGITSVELLLDMDSVETYDELLAAMNVAITNYLVSADPTNPMHNVTAYNDKAVFTATPTGSSDVTGQSITLINSGAEQFSAGSWTTAKGVPATSEFFSDQTLVGPADIESLITSTIILDDVGRGSNGGDLVVGGLSTGDTSNSQGVEQFDIYVDRNSKLGTINSTNNMLREVFIVNEDNNADSDSEATGSLWVGGQTNAAGVSTAHDGTAVVTGNENELPGDTAQDNEFGFSDVRVIDASTMVGEVHLTAELTNAVVAKYMDSVDVDGNPRADNQVTGDFAYTMGTADDSFALTMSNANLEAAGTTTREDFSLVIDGAAGDDSITTTIENSNVSDATNWYLNSKENANLTVNGGADNDMIHTSGAGDVIINAGSGDDTVYADNSGNANTRATVTEVQTITLGKAGDLGDNGLPAGPVNGQVTLTLSDGQTFTTGNASAAIVTGDTATTVGDALLLEMAGRTETSVVTFNVAAMAASDTMTIDGLTLTATGAVTTAQVISAFSGGALTNSTLSGAYSNFSAGTTTATTIVYTSTTATTAVADIALGVTGGGGVVIPTEVTIQGVTAATNVTATNVAGVVTLNYGAAYAAAGSEDIAMATVSDIATDAAATNAVGTAGVDATAITAATKGVLVLQYVVDATPVTVTLDGPSVTDSFVIADTDLNTTISLVEGATQLAAATYTDYVVTGSNISLGQVFLEAKVAGLTAAAVTGAVTTAGIDNTTGATITTADGAAIVAATAGTPAVHTLTITDGADRTGQVTINLDTDGNGTGTEAYTFTITAGNEGSVAAQLTAHINGIAGVSAVQGTAATIDDIVITWDSGVLAAATTMEDGALVSASVAETVKGLEATTAQAAAWVVNSNNTMITDLDSAGAGTTGLLYNAELTVTYSGATTRGESGVITGAAVAMTNGFESTVIINTEANTANQTSINQAIKAAIIGDGVEGGLQGAGNVLEELLSVNDGPANTLAIHSLIDGEFNEADLAITITAATFTDLTAGEQSSLRATWSDINNNSTATYTDVQMQAALDAAVVTANAGNSVQMATTDGTTLIAGAASTTVSDNTITLGTGDDVVVLGTDDQSNDTLVYTGFSNGYDSVVNFTETGAAADAIDFSAYLTAQTSTSGSGASAVDLAITLNADMEAGANEVTIINDFAGYATAGSNVTAGYSVEAVSNLVGNTYNTIFMVENGNNDGEYKVFNVEASQGTGSDFETVTLIGQVDFGNSLTAVTSSNFDGVFGA